jgi:DNA-binding CsgD family transcriptional regulator
MTAITPFQTSINHIKKAEIKKLSEKQTKIMELMCVGATTKEIARIVGGAPSTIETHIKIIFEKFQAKNRCHAVLIYILHLVHTQQEERLNIIEQLFWSIPH